MTDLTPTINSLRTALKSLFSSHAEELEAISKELKATVDYTNYYERLWLGGWAQDDYDHYQNPNNQNQAIRGTEDYFYEYLLKKANIDVDAIGQRVVELLAGFKALQQQVRTELALIKDEERLQQEIHLLEKLDQFKWGFDTMDFVKMRMPNKMVVSNPRNVNRGTIPVPPHINVIGYVTSLNTKAQAPRQFNELLTQLLRQLEIKTQRTTGSLPNATETVLKNIFENFHSFCTQLRNRHAGRTTIAVTDEYDVQDLLHAILKLHFKDVREEEFSPSYAGSGSRLDFLLKNEQIVIEVKKTRQGLADKQLGQELILDSAYYRNHPDCSRLICFVYDPENRVKNPRGLENDLKRSSDDQLSVEVFIRP